MNILLYFEVNLINNNVATINKLEYISATFLN